MTIRLTLKGGEGGACPSRVIPPSASNFIFTFLNVIFRYFKLVDGLFKKMTSAHFIDYSTHFVGEFFPKIKRFPYKDFGNWQFG